MKMRISFIVIVNALFGQLYAQPVLNTSTLPAIGYEANVHFASKIPPGASGANVVWNFKTLPTSPGDAVKVVSPASTPYFSTYNTANFCL